MLRRWLRRDVPIEGADGAPLPEVAPGGETIDDGLARTRRGLLDRLAGVFGPTDITDDTWEELTAQLIGSDVGAIVAAEIVGDTRAEARARGVRRADGLPDVLHAVIVDVLRAVELDGSTDGEPTAAMPRRPWVSLVVGVNGSGKTTTIAKLADWHRRAGRTVLLVAGDTFRAAAIEQLETWGQRIGVAVAAGQHGADPGAVVFDALSSGIGRSADVVIVDTAGRLHTQHNLMAELVKVRAVVGRVVPGAPAETLLVLDATTGQNGLAQARAFLEAVDVTGLVLAKLDSTARGGVALAVARELRLPILFVGTGEQIEDLAPFDAAAYADGLLGRRGAGSDRLP